MSLFIFSSALVPAREQPPLLASTAHQRYLRNALKHLDPYRRPFWDVFYAFWNREDALGLGHKRQPAGHLQGMEEGLVRSLLKPPVDKLGPIPLSLHALRKFDHHPGETWFSMPCQFQ